MYLRRLYLEVDDDSPTRFFVSNDDENNTRVTAVPRARLAASVAVRTLDLTALPSSRRIISRISQRKRASFDLPRRYGAESESSGDDL